MLHSTTSTSSFIVNKYSRSHPSPSANSSGSKEDGVTSSQNAEVEWQHFTNPTIRLVLDIKKASTDELESVRLRILWYMDSGGAADFGKTEPVVFVRFCLIYALLVITAKVSLGGRRIILVLFVGQQSHKCWSRASSQSCLQRLCRGHSISTPANCTSFQPPRKHFVRIHPSFSLTKGLSH